MIMSLKKKLPIEYIPRTPSQARSWVGELPLTDLGQTTKRLYTGLVDLNQSRVAPPARIEVSEAIRPVTELVLGNLRRHLVSRAFPLPKKSQKIFELNQSLLLEIAGSYQLAALDMLTSAAINRKQLLKAIFRSMDYMGRVLLQSYTVYTKTRETVWHDIHHLYLLACENGLEKIIVTKDEKHFACIEEIYIYINLLALSNPYCLRQGEIERMDRYYRGVLSTVKIYTNSDHVRGEYAHVAFLNNDDPPAVVPVQDVLNSPTIRLFNIDALVDSLESYLTFHNDNHTDAELIDIEQIDSQNMLNPGLVKRLLGSLTRVRNRRYNRQSLKNQPMQLVSGLSNIVKLLEEEPEAIKEDGNEPSDEDYIFSALNYQEVGAPQKKAPESTIPTQLWNAENNSTGGYGLCWTQDKPSGARVGEFVALKDENAHTEDEKPIWQVAVIRWLEFVKEKGLCMGIELLIPYATPLEVKKVASRKVSQQLPITGLALPILDGIRTQPEIILPEQIFKTGDKLNLNVFGQDSSIKLIFCDETIGTFDVFSYDEYENKTAIKEEDEAEEFASIWESL